MNWMREDAAKIAADLEDANSLADDALGVLAVMLSIVDTAGDQYLTLNDDFTVAGAETLIDELSLDADWLYAHTDSVARNMTSDRVIIRRDDEYPQGLLRMEHPPHILYASGDLDLLGAPGINAIVGSRTITNAQRAFIAAAGRREQGVVSGLAPGTDHVAMTAALDAGNRVVGVLGCGLNHAFGPHDIHLARRVADQGLLISEYPLGVKPVAQRLLRRNEIIAGLSETFIACVAQFKGGTYSGLRRAEKMGVPIRAVRGTPALDAWLKANPEREYTLDGAGVETSGGDPEEDDILTMELPTFEDETASQWARDRVEADRTREKQDAWLASISRKHGI